MASTLTIAGTTINRPAAHAVLTRLQLSLDEQDELEFLEVGAMLPGQWHPGQSVDLTVDGVPAFKGQIIGRHPSFGAQGWTINYHCLGLKYLGNTVPVTNPFDLTGMIVYNLPFGDEEYIAANSGLSVGAILQRVLDGHATALMALGIAGYVAADLTPLTVVPPEPIVLQGPQVIAALDDFLDQWSGTYTCSVEWNPPTSDWRVRFRDTTALPVLTLTLGTDPVEPPQISRDIAQCFSRLVIRGRGEIEAAYLSTLLTNLVRTWTDADETAWKWSDFSNPAGGADKGTITVLAPTSVTVHSANASRTWAVNYWSDLGAWVSVLNPATVDLGQQEYRRVTANTALAAGGTSVLTLDRPLSNSGYTDYRLLAEPPNTRADVYRRYHVADAYIAAHLARRFPVAVPWPAGGMFQLVEFPVGEVDTPSGSGGPWPFEIDQEHGDIVFIRPTVAAFNAQSDMDLGGAHVIKPADVKVLVPYSRGTLMVVAPPDIAGVPQYQGTLYTQDGVVRTRTIDIPSFLTPADAPGLQLMAQMHLDMVKDSVLTGTVVYNGKYSPALTLGKSLNLAGNGFTTGLESAAIPIREVTLVYPPEGGLNWQTQLSLSNRRKAATGDSLFLPRRWDRPNLDAGGGLITVEGVAVGFVGGAGIGGLEMDEFGMPLGGLGSEFGTGFGQGTEAGSPFEAATAGWLGGAEQTTSDWMTGAGMPTENPYTPEQGRAGRVETPPEAMIHIPVNPALSDRGEILGVNENEEQS